MGEEWKKDKEEEIIEILQPKGGDRQSVENKTNNKTHSKMINSLKRMTARERESQKPECKVETTALK